MPTDITPPELWAENLTGETAAWITDPVATPQEVAADDWDPGGSQP